MNKLEYVVFGECVIFPSQKTEQLVGVTHKLCLWGSSLEVICRFRQNLRVGSGGHSGSLPPPPGSPHYSPEAVLSLGSAHWFLRLAWVEWLGLTNSDTSPPSQGG